MEGHGCEKDKFKDTDQTRCGYYVGGQPASSGPVATERETARDEPVGVGPSEEEVFEHEMVDVML